MHETEKTTRIRIKRFFADPLKNLPRSIKPQYNKSKIIPRKKLYNPKKGSLQNAYKVNNGDGK